MSFKEFLMEDEFDSKDFLNDLPKGSEIKILKNDYKIGVKVMDVYGNNFGTKNGVVPVLKNFNRKGKNKIITIPKGTEVVIDVKKDTVYGMINDFFFSSNIVHFDELNN